MHSETREPIGNPEAGIVGIFFISHGEGAFADFYRWRIRKLLFFWELAVTVPKRKYWRLLSIDGVGGENATG